MPASSDDASFGSERSAFMSVEDEAQRPNNARKNIWWSLGKSIVQGFCKPKRNVFTTDDIDDDERDDREWSDFSEASTFPSITTLVTRQHSPNYYYGSTQSILEIWIAACVLLGWTIRVLQYKDTTLALSTAVANKF